MRICLVSNYVGSLEEGMMNISFHLSENLSLTHEVLHVNARKSLLSSKTWQRIRTFDPQIIHVLLRPCKSTLLLIKFLRYHCSNAKVLLSALQPPHGLLSMRLASFLKPDLVLIQSPENENLFARIGCKTVFLPNGVDTNKFIPVSASTKAELRKKYSVGLDKFVVLHVGHLIKGRNIEALGDLQRDNNQVIIVGSTIFKRSEDIYGNLKARGCTVWNKYISKIEEVYALSDCYVFPTISKSNCVEIPLSMMEAMSCNLPVISTNFGMLPELFQDGEGLRFVEENLDFLSELHDLKSKIAQNNFMIDTRKKVLPYSWDRIVAKLETAYINAIAE